MDLTHVDDKGQARMVDIAGKTPCARAAIAQAFVRMSGNALRAVRDNTLAKGDALGVARVAGILAAKRVDELIPLCHTLALSDVLIDFSLDERGVRIMASASTVAQTGVEMEALTAASVAALTVYDMVKAIDKRIVIEDVRLLKKTGGKSGDYAWDPSE
jgi:cyclic pyranopterin phosphate synthase